MDHLVFPDGVQVIRHLVDGKEFAGLRVRAGSFIPVDGFKTLPFVHVIGQGGTPGYVDQVERIRLEVYGFGNDALRVAQDIRAQLVGENISTPAGFVDSIKSDQVPSSTPYHDTTDVAVLLLSVISRPV